LRWLDGSATTVSALLDTTLAVSLVGVPDSACGPYYVDFCPETLTMPVTIRATAADGSLAADLPAELLVDVSTAGSATEAICGESRTPGEIEGLRIIADNVPVPASALPPAVWSPERGDAALALRRFMGSTGPYAEAEVIPLELVDPELTSPLDSTVDAAPECVVHPSSEGRSSDVF
jgi:hypothetical protein